MFKKIFEFLEQDSFSLFCTSGTSTRAVSSCVSYLIHVRRAVMGPDLWVWLHLLSQSSLQPHVGLQTVKSAKGCFWKGSMPLCFVHTEWKSEYKGDISCRDLSWWLLPVLVHQRVVFHKGEMEHGIVISVWTEGGYIARGRIWCF